MPVLDATYFIDQVRSPRLAGPAVHAVRAYAAARAEPLLVPLHVVVEVAAGAADPAEAWTRIEAGHEVVPLDRAAGFEASRLARDAIARGQLPGWHDVETAAVASLRGMVVVTRNPEHFTRNSRCFTDQRGPTPRIVHGPSWEYLPRAPSRLRR